MGFIVIEAPKRWDWRVKFRRISKYLPDKLFRDEEIGTADLEHIYVLFSPTQIDQHGVSGRG